MVLVRLTCFLEQQDIFSPVQAGFRPGRSTVDQVLLLSQSIADSFHQFKPGARTVLATVDFAKAFDSVWHSALLSKLLSLNLSLLLNGYDPTSQIVVRRSASVIHIVVLSVSEKVFPKVQFLDQFSSPYTSINDLPTFLPTSVKTSLYADDLAIWASSPSVECATSTVQAALNRLVEWFSNGAFPTTLSNVKHPSSA